VASQKIPTYGVVEIFRAFDLLVWAFDPEKALRRTQFLLSHLVYDELNTYFWRYYIDG
jgi:hypothetical protein